MPNQHAPDLPSPAAPQQITLASIAPEIVIQIRPRGQIVWTGTQAQITAEVPHIKCPAWADPRLGPSTQWEEGIFDYWLLRHRPDTMSGKDWKASDRDHWSLHQRLAATRGDGFAAADLYEKREALRLEIWAQSLEGRLERGRAISARVDNAYCRFMALAGAVKQRKARAGK